MLSLMFCAFTSIFPHRSQEPTEVSVLASSSSRQQRKNNLHRFFFSQVALFTANEHFERAV